MKKKKYRALSTNVNTTVYLNIGSNKGDRPTFIAQAVAALYTVPGMQVEAVRLSEYVESEPWGFCSQNAFLNLGVAVDAVIDKLWCRQSLIQLLRDIKLIERSISGSPHRNADNSYADREIDIDIIAVDRLSFSSEELSIPHPHMHLRPFVLQPMAELAPGWQHPLLGATAAELLLSTK